MENIFYTILIFIGGFFFVQFIQGNQKKKDLEKDTKAIEKIKEKINNEKINDTVNRLNNWLS